MVEILGTIVLHDKLTWEERRTLMSGFDPFAFKKPTERLKRSMCFVGEILSAFCGILICGIAVFTAGLEIAHHFFDIGAGVCGIFGHVLVAPLAFLGWKIFGWRAS